jgi:uncharacterized protein with NRDE domain
MCLIAFAIGLHTQCPLLIASNRDEFWHRPTLPLAAWQLPNGTEVYAGRDEQAGGTWLGFNAAGRVAMLTNVRSGQAEAAPRSRGELVTRWLAGANATPDWPSLMDDTEPADYGGFNLVLGDVHTQTWTWLSNRAPDGHANTHHTGPLNTPAQWHGRSLSAGVYGLSNAGLNTPWPKTRALQQATTHALQMWGAAPEQGAWQQPLLHALLDLRRAPSDTLPQTGVPLEREQALSSAFVHMPDAGYGTRSSLLAHWNGHTLALDEWTHPTGPRPKASERWPLEHSHHRRMSISMWGMPTSS